MTQALRKKQNFLTCSMQEVIVHNSIPDINEDIINKGISYPESFTEQFCRGIEKIECKKYESRKNNFVIFK
jgi:hypothetical protein